LDCGKNECTITIRKKCDLLQNRLHENLEKKDALELRNNQESEDLRRLKIS
jgi:hypothetical protein